MATLTSSVRVPPTKKNKVATRKPPPCKNCKYYEKNENSCRLFFSQSPMSGELVYYDAEISRFEKNLCGWDGRYFDLLDPLP